MHTPTRKHPLPSAESVEHVELLRLLLERQNPHARVRSGYSAAPVGADHNVKTFRHARLFVQEPLHGAHDAWVTHTSVDLGVAIAAVVERFRQGASDNEVTERLSALESQVVELRQQLDQVNEAMAAAAKADAEFDSELAEFATHNDSADPDEVDDFDYSAVYDELELRRD